MRFRPRAQNLPGPSQVSVIPFINTVFLLLIFLAMACGLMLLGGGLSLGLPRVVTSDGMIYENIVLSVNSADDIYLNSRQVSIEELGRLFEQLCARKYALLVKSDKKASLGRISQICDLAKAKGITHLNIATNR